MIRYEEHPTQGFVELTIDGKVDRESFEEVVSQLGPFMEQRGKVGVLKNIQSFGGIAPAVLWDDIKFGFAHLKNVGPVAVVSDKKWIAAWTKLAAPFWASEVRFFESGELAQARQWLGEQMAATSASE